MFDGVWFGVIVLLEDGGWRLVVVTMMMVYTTSEWLRWWEMEGGWGYGNGCGRWLTDSVRHSCGGSRRSNDEGVFYKCDVVSEWIRREKTKLLESVKFFFLFLQQAPSFSEETREMSKISKWIPPQNPIWSLSFVFYNSFTFCLTKKRRWGPHMSGTNLSFFRIMSLLFFQLKR